MESRSWHHDHTASPGQHQGEEGHCWIVLDLHWRHVSCSWLCLALKPALYVREVDCAKTNRPLKTKLELGNERDIHPLSRLKRTAVFRDPAPPRTGKRGRPRKYGASHMVAAWAQQAAQSLFEVTRCGETTTLRIAKTTGHLHGIERLVRIIAVWDRGEKAFFLFTIDFTPVEILEYYAARFEEEVAFRDLKQEVDFGDYRLRKESTFTSS